TIELLAQKTRLGRAALSIMARSRFFSTDLSRFGRVGRIVAREVTGQAARGSAPLSNLGRYSSTALDIPPRSSYTPFSQFNGTLSQANKIRQAASSGTYAEMPNMTEAEMVTYVKSPAFNARVTPKDEARVSQLVRESEAEYEAVHGGQWEDIPLEGGAGSASATETALSKAGQTPSEAFAAGETSVEVGMSEAAAAAAASAGSRTGVTVGQALGKAAGVFASRVVPVINILSMLYMAGEGLYNAAEAIKKMQSDTGRDQVTNAKLQELMAKKDEFTKRFNELFRGLSKDEKAYIDTVTVPSNVWATQSARNSIGQSTQSGAVASSLNALSDKIYDIKDPELRRAFEQETEALMREMYPADITANAYTGIETLSEKFFEDYYRNFDSFRAGYGLLDRERNVYNAMNQFYRNNFQEIVQRVASRMSRENGKEAVLDTAQYMGTETGSANANGGEKGPSTQNIATTGTKRSLPSTGTEGPSYQNKRMRSKAPDRYFDYYTARQLFCWSSAAYDDSESLLTKIGREYESYTIESPTTGMKVLMGFDSDECIVAFRGTYNAQNAVIDSKIWRAAPSRTSAIEPRFIRDLHAGFFEAWESVKDSVL
ncbi:hypothetical protein, partial [Aquabacterium sp.]|uniref:hypothetical protein n=1 Tax=Aquabacterium sp. TaxID=1872578 RepID=UPI0025B9F3A3